MTWQAVQPNFFGAKKVLSKSSEKMGRSWREVVAEGSSTKEGAQRVGEWEEVVGRRRKPSQVKVTVTVEGKCFDLERTMVGKVEAVRITESKRNFSTYCVLDLEAAIWIALLLELEATKECEGNNLWRTTTNLGRLVAERTWNAQGEYIKVS